MIPQTIEAEPEAQPFAKEDEEKFQPFDNTIYMQSAPAPKAKKSLEFHIGSVVTGVVGAVLIILSMILFGKNYMDNLSQGIALYAIGIVVIAFSEAVLKKHVESFSRVVSGLGLAILYTATILNYLYLGTMGATAAIIITIVVSVFALVFSRTKDSGFLRIIGILGCYVSFFPLEGFNSSRDFIIPAVILLIVNMLYLFMPNKTYKKAIQIIHMIANVCMALYVLIFMELALSNVKDKCFIAMLVFLAALTVIDVFIRMSAEDGGELFVSLACEIILSVFALIWTGVSDQIVLPIVFFSVAMAICFAIDWKKGWQKWVHMYILAVFVLGVSISAQMVVQLIIIACVLAVFKLFAARNEVGIAAIIVSVYSAIAFIANVNDPSNMQYLILAVLVLFAIFPGVYKTANEVILMLTLQGYAIAAFEETQIRIPLGLLFLVIYMILLKYYGSLRDKNFTVVKWTSVVSGVIWIIASGAMGTQHFIAKTMVLVLGLLFIFILFSAEYMIAGDSSPKVRNICLAIYCTFMIFVYRIDKPIINSILLMVLAIVCVATGFAVKQKPLRLYGLVLSLFVCAKLLLSDFADSSSGDKVIITFVVGILAIGIAYIYMRLENSSRAGLMQNDR